MIAEIIAIGTELTSGQKLDTNSQWLSLQLAELGIPVHYHTTVADDFDANLQVLRIAAGRADLVLITGGLGPTLDDLTRDVLARLAGVELELHQPSLDFIEEFFRHRGREMPARNRTQALFPAGSTPLPNPVGTAPGIWMELPRSGARGACLIAAMPGVPSEMHRLFHEQVRPRLRGGENIIRRARINCFGLGESHTEELLGELTARGRDPEIGITAHDATITLRILAHGRSEAECAAKIDAARLEIRRRLGHYVFGEEDDEVEHVLLKLLSERGLTLATGEAGTGGLLAQTLAAVPGFETSYLGGLVLPASPARRDVLGIEDADAPVSAEAAKALAAATRERFGADFGLAVSQFPVLDLSSLMTSAPPAYIALADREQVIASLFNLGGNPAILRSRTAKSAMNLLRLRLLRHGR